MGNVMTFVRDGLASLVSGLGTERDKAASVYYAEPTITDEQLVNAYRGSWMARKIVDIPALDSCRAWRAWQAKGPQIEAIEAEEKRLNVKGKVLEARRKARLFGGAAIYIDLGDDPSQPLSIERVKKDGVRFLTVLTRRQLLAGDIDTDPLSEFYGRPKEYSLAAGAGGFVRIHPSRLAIFYGADLPDRDYATGTSFAWADSVLVSVMEAVKQAESAAANIASLIFEANVDVITMNGLMEKVGNPADEEKILRRYSLAAQAKGVNKMLLIDGNEKYERKTVTFATLPDLLDRFGQNAAGAADIPMTRFMGQAPAGLNSTGESDLRNYYDRISAGQQLEMQPAMNTLDECLIRSALGSRDADIHYDWNPLWQLGEKEKADIFKAKADAARAIAGKGGMEPPLMPIEALSDALVNELVEDGTLAGLEAAIDEYGKLSEQEEDEADIEAAAGPEVSPERRATGAEPEA